MAKNQEARWPYDPRVKRLLRTFIAMAKEVKRQYAIGGALSMSAHGYSRETKVVDAFLLERDRLTWLRAARKHGLTVDNIFGHIHYIAFFPKDGDARIRIAMLFPAAEPDLSAVEHPSKGTIGGIKARIFPVELLAIAKFISDRPEDNRDFTTMFNLGLFEPTTVRAILRSFESRDVIASYNHVVAELSRPKRPPSGAKSGQLKRLRFSR